MQGGAEILAADELHRNEGDPVGFVDLVDHRDVGVLERGSGLRFLDEPPAAIGIGHQLRNQDLESDLSVQPHVHRPVHDAHAASADFADDLVMGEPAARQLRPPFRDATRIIAQQGENEIASGGSFTIAICGSSSAAAIRCLRTLPVRGHGGNFDVKAISFGASLLRGGMPPLDWGYTLRAG